MKLTSEDKKILTGWGYRDSDLKQIETATSKTIYTSEGEKISLTEVLEILDRETYLSGISRSAFHWSCSRTNNEGKTVSFDSSRLFR